MSHNIVMNNVKFKDLGLLSKVVSDLSDNKASLTRDATTFRTWPGQPDKCHARIDMPGKHDIGLLRQSDGSYSPVYDPYAMTKIFQHSAFPAAHIGLLQQEVALREAEYEAAQQGYSTERISGEKGLISLKVVAG